MSARRLRVEVIALLSLAVPALRALRLVRVRRLVALAAGSARGGSVAEVGRVVTAASRRIPGASCVPQAVVAEALLRRAGLPATLRVGVRKQGDDLLAHAWTESDGVVVVGGDVTGFTPIV